MTHKPISRRHALAVTLAAATTAATTAGTTAARAANPPTPIDDFGQGAQGRWQFFSDQVMGGVSTGDAQVAQSRLRLTGEVSTANNGGFIQARLKLDKRLPEAARALVLRVRGNGAGYFVHLRTGGTLLPWQYYQAPFATRADWTEVELPFAAFKPSGGMLRAEPAPASVRSVAIVAYGSDYTADVSVDWIGWR